MLRRGFLAVIATILAVIGHCLLCHLAQERLRNWEVREAKKAKDYEKEKAKEKKKTDEQEREAKKLKEFLEDYDDERDDPKFYKGRELARRLTDRYSRLDWF